MFHPTKTAQSDRDITEKPLPLYRVTVRQDAWINHVTLIRAESAADACEAALDGWNGDETIKFVDEGATGFDDGQCDPEDDVELVPVEREAEDETDFAKSLAGEDSTIIALSKAELRLLATIVGQHADDIHEDNPQDAAPVQALFEKVKGYWQSAGCPEHDEAVTPARRAELLHIENVHRPLTDAEVKELG